MPIGSTFALKFFLSFAQPYFKTRCMHKEIFTLIPSQYCKVISQGAEESVSTGKIIPYTGY